MNQACNTSWANFGSNSSNELKQSVSGNDSACTEAFLQSATAMNPFEEFFKAAFGSSIFITMVSLTTIYYFCLFFTSTL